MATELASGFISLSVRYASAMRQVNQDFQALETMAKRSGTDAGNALSQSMGRAAKLDASDTKRTFSTLESSARKAGEDAGQDLGRGLVSGAKREVSSAGDEIGAGLADGVSQAGGAAGTGFMAALGPKLASIGSKAGPVGAAIVAAGAVLGGLLANEVFNGFERDMANRKLQVQLGIDPAQMAGVNEAINNAYKNNFGESIDGLREDAAAIIKNGLVKATDTQGLQTALQQFDTVAQVTGSTTEEISAAVSRLVKAGVVKDFAAGLDLVTVAGQKGLDTSGELLDTLTEYSVQFQKVGIDGQQSLGLIKQLMDGGARSVDLAADAIKEFSIRSIDGSKGTVDAYTSIGLNADEMAQKLAAGGPAATQAFDQIVDKLQAIQDPVARNAAGVALFGTQWEDLGAAINNLDPSTARDAIGEVDGAVQKASDTLGGGALSGFQSLGRSFEVMRGQLQDFLAKAFGPMAQRLSEWLTNVLPRIGDAFSSIMPAVSEFFSGVKDGGAVIGGQWIDNVKSLWPEIQKLGSAMKDAFVAALPVIKGVATAFGAFVLVAMKVGGAVLPVVTKGFTMMYDAISFVYTSVVPRVTGAFQAIGSAAMALWNSAIQPAWNGIKAAITGAWSVISTVFDAFKTAVSAIGSVAAFVFNDFIVKGWNLISTAASAAWSVISPIFDGIGTGVSAVGSAFSNVFASAISPVWESIKSAFSTGWSFLSGIFEQMKSGFQGVADFIKGVWNGIGGAIKGALDSIANAIRPILHQAGSLLIGVPDIIPGSGTLNALGQKLQAFRTGGTVSGPGGTDNVLAWLTAGEGVVTKTAMANGGADLVAALNAGWVPPVEMLRSMLPGFANGGVAGAVQFAQEYGDGRRYVYGGTGPQGFDCSGFMSAIYGVVTDQDPFKRYFTTESNFEALGFQKGYMPGAFNIGIRRGGGGPNSHMAGTLPNGVNVESGGQDSTTKYGGDAQGAQAFPLQYFLPVQGNPTGGTVGSSVGGSGGGGGSWSSTGGSGGSGAGGGGTGGAGGSDPFSQILSGFGQLGDLAKDGLIESFLPPGFNNPLDGSLFKSAAGVLNFAGSLTNDPVAKGILGIASQAVGGSPSGVINGIGALIPQPFGSLATDMAPGDFSAAQHQGTGALPGPGFAAAYTPDPDGTGGGGVVNNDNSVHVAEGGQINQNAEQILDKTQRQQRAQQNPQLGTRRY